MVYNPFNRSDFYHRTTFNTHYYYYYYVVKWSNKSLFFHICSHLDRFEQVHGKWIYYACIQYLLEKDWDSCYVLIMQQYSHVPVINYFYFFLTDKN